MQFAIQEELLYAECGARLKNFYLSKVTVFAVLFWKKILTKQNIASTEIIYQFLAPKGSRLEEK